MHGSGFVPFIEPETLTALPGEAGGIWASIPEHMRLGLVAAYKFNDATDELGALDLTNNGCTFEAGQDGNAARFVNTESDTFTHAAFPTSASWTISARIYGGPALANADLIEAVDVWPFSTWAALYVSGGVWFALAGNGAGSYANATGPAFVPEQWNHVYAWFDESDNKVRIRVNGGAVAVSAALTGSLHLSGGTTPLSIGFGPGASAYFFGLMDEVLIYSRALSAQEQDDFAETYF